MPNLTLTISLHNQAFLCHVSVEIVYQQSHFLGNLFLYHWRRNLFDTEKMSTTELHNKLMFFHWNANYYYSMLTRKTRFHSFHSTRSTRWKTFLNGKFIVNENLILPFDFNLVARWEGFRLRIMQISPYHTAAASEINLISFINSHSSTTGPGKGRKRSLSLSDMEFLYPVSTRPNSLFLRAVIASKSPEPKS